MLLRDIQIQVSADQITHRILYGIELNGEEWEKKKRTGDDAFC